MNKKIKTSGDADSRAAKQLENILDREGIVSQQKCSMFLQMLEYKKLNEEVMKRNEELIKENSALMNVLGEFRHDKENSDNKLLTVGGVSPVNADSKIASLNREISRLTAVVCELEKNILRKELFENNTAKDVQETVEDKVVRVDSSLIDDGVYKSVVEDAAELKAMLSTLKNEYELELSCKQLEINKLTQEVNGCSSEIREVGERSRRMEAELSTYRSKAVENDLKNKEEAEKQRLRMLELEENVESLTLDIERKEKRIIQLKVEKEELNKLLDSYKTFIEREVPGNGDLEEEIGNLISSLDKSLSENKRLIRECEKLHEENEALGREVINLKICNGELVSQSSKLESEMRELKREVKNCFDASDESVKIKKLEENVEESFRSINEYKKRLCKMSMEKDSTEKALEDIKRQNKGMKDELSRSVKKVYMLEIDNKRMSEVMNVMREGSEDPDMIMQLEKYRSLLRCSLCDSRFKNTAIIKCMHCFCEECVNARIKMRDRKCPSCNESFSTGDVKKIYL